MKKGFSLMCGLLLSINYINAYAASPLPSFDKTAVTEYPYYKTGNQNVEVEKSNDVLGYQPGNTGTVEHPAFFVKKIKLTGFTLPEQHNEETLQSILDQYSHRSVSFEELDKLTAKITAYARACGFTVSQAVVPQQEIKNGQLEIAVYVASFDSVKVNSNNTEVADRVLQRFAKHLHEGDVITDKNLETTMNNMNDLPGVIARATLYPGSRPGTTGLNIDAIHRKVWNNYIFADNGGTKTSGCYRYGFHTELNNPGHQGDKIGLTGSISNKDTDNYGVNYETAMGGLGTRWGVGYSKSSYDIGWFGRFMNPLGESEGLSFYGLTPIYRDRAKRITAIYGYDHRNIEDTIRYNLGSVGQFNNKIKKSADVFHVGIAASEYEPNRFTSGNLIYWYGDIDVKHADAYYEGGYHKLTADFSHVRYWTDWNLRVEAHAQLANRDLDGSERFYLGGMNSIRAYPASETSGDYGYNATVELRRQTGIEGLEAAAFVDVGEVKLAKSANEHMKLAGWGLGLRYSKSNDWYAQFDYAWKIDGEPYMSEDHDHDGRMWFQVYKMF